MQPKYFIQTAQNQPELAGLWEGPSWSGIETIQINTFRPESSSHRPETRCKLQYDTSGIYGIFKVRDKYMRCVHTEFQSDVWKDSCVEIFLTPNREFGYFNFEFNCLGVLQSSHITDERKVKGVLTEYKPLQAAEGETIKRYHSLQDLESLDEDREVTWYLEFFIPFQIFKNYLGKAADSRTWSGNLFKCGDETSHPHWASWAPLEELNFHKPNNFGSFLFEQDRTAL